MSHAEFVSWPCIKYGVKFSGFKLEKYFYLTYKTQHILNCQFIRVHLAINYAFDYNRPAIKPSLMKVIT